MYGMWGGVVRLVGGGVARVFVSVLLRWCVSVLPEVRLTIIVM